MYTQLYMCIYTQLQIQTNTGIYVAGIIGIFDMDTVYVDMQVDIDIDDKNTNIDTDKDL